MNLPLRPLRIAIAIELHWNLPWHLDVYQGIAEYGRERGWQCAVDPYLDGVIGEGDLSGYDGVVGRMDDGMVERVVEAGVPAVNLQLRRQELGIPTLRVDTAGCARLAAEHLIASGYRRVAFVGIRRLSPWIKELLISTFSRVTTAQGLAEPLIIEFESGELGNPEKSKEVRRAITQWIKTLQKPIGLYIYQGEVARYLAQICEQLEVRVPEDVGLVVHDIDTVTATSITPTLSAIDMDYWAWGQQAAGMLDGLMQGKSPEPRVRLVSPRRVIVRESSDVFVCSDELVSRAMRLIAERSREPLRVEEIAARLSVSRRTLDRRFDAVLGRSVSQEAARLRNRDIERILLETDLPILKVAEICGFSSASHFTQYFSKHAGETPSAYRRRMAGPVQEKPG